MVVIEEVEMRGEDLLESWSCISYRSASKVAITSDLLVAKEKWIAKSPNRTPKKPLTTLGLQSSNYAL
jgi:hypothetical protein